MPRKAFSLLAALMLLFSATALAAPQKYSMVEDFQKFDVEVEIPQRALHKQPPQEGWLEMEIWYEGTARPSFTITVFSSEEQDSKFLADFTQEETDRLLAAIGEDFSAPSQEFFVTPSGNKILLTAETDPEAGDYAIMVTVYQGFFFSMYCSRQEYAPLTEEDLALMHQILEGTWIIDTEK